MKPNNHPVAHNGTHSETLNAVNSGHGTLVFENPQEAKGYTVISNFVLFDPTVSPAAKTTYALLLSFAWQAEQSFPGQIRLAEILGVKERMVRYYLSELVSKKYIRVKRRGLGKTNLYIITDLSRTQRIAGAHAQSSGKAERQPIADQDRQSISHSKRQPITDKQDIVEQDAIEQDSDHSKFRNGNTLQKISAEWVREERRGGRATSVRQTPETRKDDLFSRKIARVLDALSKHELNDPTHIRSNISRAMNLWRQSNIPEESFLVLLGEARKITRDHSGSIRKRADNYMGLKNHAPYFFRVLQDRLTQKTLATFRSGLAKRVAMR